MHAMTTRARHHQQHAPTGSRCSFEIAHLTSMAARGPSAACTAPSAPATLPRRSGASSRICARGQVQVAGQE